MTEQYNSEFAELIMSLETELGNYIGFVKKVSEIVEQTKAMYQSLNESEKNMLVALVCIRSKRHEDVFYEIKEFIYNQRCYNSESVALKAMLVSKLFERRYDETIYDYWFKWGSRLGYSTFYQLLMETYREAGALNRERLKLSFPELFVDTPPYK